MTVFSGRCDICTGPSAWCHGHTLLAVSRINYSPNVSVVWGDTLFERSCLQLVAISRNGEN